MRHPVPSSAAVLVAALTVVAVPAVAQQYGYTDRDYSYGYGHPAGNHRYNDTSRNYAYGDTSRDHGHARTGWGSVPTTFDWRSQLDRPGDYRCDAFWDASRTDCAAPWRDQRRSSRYGRGERDYGYAGGQQYGYRASYGGHTYSNHPYSTRQRGYGRASFSNGGGEAWHGAYGRPDLVYSDNDSYVRRDHGRAAWCRSTYRSYDPASGYYRAYSGRLVYCG